MTRLVVVAKLHSCSHLKVKDFPSSDIQFRKALYGTALNKISELPEHAKFRSDLNVYFADTPNSTMMRSYALALALVFVGTSAHSRLTYPPRERDPYCSASAGCVPCMEPEKWADNGFSATNPGARWKRGQEVTYVYERNNHKEGMVRLAILPMNKRGDKRANNNYAFMYHCYAGKERTCPTKEVCGSDESGQQYRVKFTVPTVIPDGVYHFSWTWWGGGNTGANPLSYTTLYSCSVVEISGGTPLQTSWPVLFEASEHEENEPGKCASHARSEDECTSAKRFCPNKPEIQILAPGFSSAGESPDRFLTPGMFGATDVPTKPAQPTNPSIQTTSTPEASMKPTSVLPSTAPARTTMPKKISAQDTTPRAMVNKAPKGTRPVAKCRDY